MNRTSQAILFLFLVIVPLLLMAQALPEWAVSFGEAGSDDEIGGFSLSIDPTGNLYVSGSYYSSISFGSHSLSSPQTGVDLYVAKKPLTGDWLWAAGGICDVSVFGRNYIDAAGNCFIYGEYLGTLCLGAHTLVNPNPSLPIQFPQAFIAQLDGAGNWLGAQNIPLNILGGICRDGSGNFYLCGYNQEFHENKVLKLDPDLQPVWTSIAFIGANSSRAIHVDSGGTVHYVASNLLLRMDPTGAVMGNVPLPGAFKDFAFAADGSKYHRGFASGALDFGDIPFAGGGFLAKLNAANAWAWVLPDGATDANEKGGVATDGSGNAYISGAFTGTRAFAELTLTNTGGEDLFIAKADSDGEWLWAKQGGGPLSGDMVGQNGLEVGPTGNIYPCGSFRGTIGLGSATLASSSLTEADLFLALMNQPTLTLIAPEPGAVWTMGSVYPVIWGFTCHWAPGGLDLSISSIPEGDVVLESDDVSDVDAGILLVTCPSGLDHGDYELQLSYSDSQTSSSADIIIDYPASLPPENVQIRRESNDVVVTWEPVTQNVNGQPQTPSGYQIYMSPHPDCDFFAYGNPVTECSFTDHDGAPYRRFYRVVALYDGPPPP
jgi:hypothetical protein